MSFFRITYSKDNIITLSEEVYRENMTRLNETIRNTKLNINNLTNSINSMTKELNNRNRDLEKLNGERNRIMINIRANDPKRRNQIPQMNAQLNNINNSAKSVSGRISTLFSQIANLRQNLNRQKELMNNLQNELRVFQRATRVQSLRPVPQPVPQPVIITPVNVQNPPLTSNPVGLPVPQPVVMSDAPTVETRPVTQVINNLPQPANINFTREQVFDQNNLLIAARFSTGGNSNMVFTRSPVSTTVTPFPPSTPVESRKANLRNRMAANVAIVEAGSRLIEVEVENIKRLEKTFNDTVDNNKNLLLIRENMDQLETLFEIAFNVMKRTETIGEVNREIMKTQMDFMVFSQMLKNDFIDDKHTFLNPVEFTRVINLEYRILSVSDFLKTCIKAFKHNYKLTINSGNVDNVNNGNRILNLIISEIFKDIRNKFNNITEDMRNAEINLPIFEGVKLTEIEKDVADRTIVRFKQVKESFTELDNLINNYREQFVN